MFDIATRLIDLPSLALVLAGSAIAAGLRSTREDLRRALAALRPLLAARPALDTLTARRDLRRIEAVVRNKGLAAAERVRLDGAFSRRAVLRLVDAPHPDAFAGWAAADLEERAARHEAAPGVWRAAADAAPAMGMIGTVIGLIGMFAAMDDPDRIGAAMALAMLSTLYGLLGGVAGGLVAARLERLAALERRWQRVALARLEALARAEATAPADLVQTLRAAE